jgi:hypothetical protein
MKKTILAAVAVLALLCSATLNSHATDDGTPSTGSFTVVNVAPLASATATGNATVLDTATIRGTRLNIGAYTFTAGIDYAVGATTNATAANLAAAITASAAPVTAAAVGTNVVTLTADNVGSLYNAVTLKTSSSGDLSVSGATLTGGQNNASIAINAVSLVQGRDWFIQDVASNTAVNLAAAINHNGPIHNLVEATWLGGASATVYLRAILSPVAYTLLTSDPTDLSVTGAAVTPASGSTTMTGGAPGTLARNTCFLGTVNALPTSNYPQGCLLYLNSDATHLYISTQAVTGAATNAANSWLAK